MPQPVWRKIVTELQVPKTENLLWTMALEYLTPGKIMKIEVVVDAARTVERAGNQVAISGNWTPAGFHAACAADGDMAGTAREQPAAGSLPVTAASPGALIARIGGSTADLGADTPPPPPPGTSARIVFSVGRMCVFTVPTNPTGSLFLGINIDPNRMTGTTGFQVVNMYEAL